MNQNMTVSVVLACCRGERFLAEQLQSLLAQTLVPDEIVVCDDSPDDASRRIAASFDRVRVLVNSSPLGVAGNFARGIAEAKGKLIFLSDQDDVWKPEKVEHMVSALGEAGGVFCNSELVTERLESMHRDHWTMRGFPAAELTELRQGPSRKRMAELFCRRVLPAAHDMMFRAELCSRILPFPELPACHDSWIGIAVAETAGWAVCNEKLTLFRQHGNNLSGMGKLSAWQAAKKSVRDNTFLWNEELYRAAFERFHTPLLAARAAHSAARAGMDIPFPRRLVSIWHEWHSGNYRRFARGWESVVQDLFLRDSRIRKAGKPC